MSCAGRRVRCGWSRRRGCWAGFAGAALRGVRVVVVGAGRTGVRLALEGVLRRLKSSGELIGPGPRGREMQAGGAGVEGSQSGGDVQKAVAQALGFGGGELAGQAAAVGSR